MGAVKHLLHDQQQEEDQPMPIFSELKSVDRYTRAGLYGKFITCPKCYSTQRVHHFAWSALGCQSCKKMVSKNEWKIHGDGTPY